MPGSRTNSCAMLTPNGLSVRSRILRDLVAHLVELARRRLDDPERARVRHRRRQLRPGDVAHRRLHDRVLDAEQLGDAVLHPAHATEDGSPREPVDAGRPTGYLCTMDLLTDLQVVDCSAGIAGGYCAKLLGGAGAEVIKVESPEGDPLRRWTNQRLLGRRAGRWRRRAVPVPALRSPLDRRDRAHRHGLTRLDELLAGADILITDARGIASTPPRCTSASRSSSSCRHHAVRPGGSVRRPPRDRAHPAGRERRARRCGRTRAADRCRWAGARWSGSAASTPRSPRSPPAGSCAAVVRASSSTCPIAGGGEHHRHHRRRPHGLAARSSEPGCAGPELRDAVDRADPRRLRRLQHQHPHAVRQLPAADRASRPHRRTATWASIGRPRRELGRVERHHPRLDAEAHDRRDRARWRPSCASRWRRCATATASSSSSSSSRAAARSSTTPPARSSVPRRPWRIDDEDPPPPRPAPRLGEHTGTIEPPPAQGRRRPGRHRAAAARASRCSTSPRGGRARRRRRCSPRSVPT